MTDIAIRIEKLSKRYRIGLREELPDTLMGAVRGWLRLPVANFQRLWRQSRFREAQVGKDIIWALRDVSFEVERGEVLGVIGRNGAGKSTLLKILSRITEPSAGRAVIRGRVASLLEVGTGFHPDLTGRENVYLNGVLLGMSKKEIDRRFDEIVTFSEVETFIDTPIKRYSSGMKVRLAFAVAAHLEPEILLVDEVLAVGDAAFQKKCLGKMDDIAREGRTVLFVSHNLLAVERLCPTVAWLAEGRLVEKGPGKSVIAGYLRSCHGGQRKREWQEREEAPGNDLVRLRRARIRSVQGPSSSAITVETPFVMEFEYWNLQPGTRLNLSVHLLNEHGVTVFNTGPVDERLWHGRAFPAGLFRSACYVPGDLLNDGTHRVRLLAVQDQSRVISQWDDVLVFEVQDRRQDSSQWYGRWPGVVRPRLRWTTELVESVDPVPSGVPL